MAMEELKFRIVGESPLVMHCGQTVDPLNQFSKAISEISSKRHKTDADHEEMMRIEWMAALYLDNGEPCIPGYVLEAAIVEAAKKLRLGKVAKSGIFVPDNMPLEYEGPRDPDELWKDDRFRLVANVRIKTSRIIRCRPIFRSWAADCRVLYDDLQINRSKVEEIIRITGSVIGIMDWRPRHGRFQVEFL